ncbi:MAG: DUF3426 domain-containing protein [Gammaproteobacteria bacterium]|nr:DUF3426 domain-containing protein [Gammaproteobacteria bacterium]NIR85828.1 DUF3426 domain-containing protein [Gammaproteobacteria bacterium]NIR90582.1 DUF3426 domain-containing protein [Gammaproteobacteria bacterium]NIU06963.1 DUF3426 domain-containing protein [Gammaproteobacteria bacterium]NIV53893.1 DUF3426 domain-containing protein [Gammaproteobacteria bacterium]
MYTRCPFCQTVFTITGAQLRAGRGTVRCGRCRKLFDALAYLSDTLAAEERAAPHEPASNAKQGPAAPAPTVAPPVEPAAQQALREESEAPRRGAQEQARAERPPTLDQSLESKAEEEEPVPQALREDVAHMATTRRRSRGGFLFGAASVLLVAALAVQYAWFMPEDVVHRYPQARVWMEAFCERTGCMLPERRDVSLIRMVSRDVRVHPRYEGALLVTAALENIAPFKQPYPQMQFTLYNVNGQTIATRRFEAHEYLAENVDVARGMPPRTPVQVALDLMAPEQAPVSFEFRFL